jgi:L-alanine-DL-glutamate epimerase-like enolase superfamily enzyme
LRSAFLLDVTDVAHRRQESRTQSQICSVQQDAAIMNLIWHAFVGIQSSHSNGYESCAVRVVVTCLLHDIITQKVERVVTDICLGLVRVSET